MAITISGSGSFTGATNEYNFDQSVGVAGTLTYDDVTSIDSVGIITAQSDVSIADKIIHTGDTNTAIRFPANNTFTVETAGSERLRIDSAGKMGLGATAPTAQLEIEGNVSSTSQFSGFQGLRIQNANGAAYGVTADINFVAGTSSNNRGAVIGALFESTNGNALYFATNGSSVSSTDTPTERMRITSAGKVGIGTNSPSELLHLSWAGGSPQLVLERTGNSTGKYSLGAVNNEFIIKDEAQNSERMRITSAGVVTINKPLMGTYGYYEGENVNYGSQLWSDSMILMRANDASAGTYMTQSATSWSAWSDERLKENITELSGALDTLKDVRCIEFSNKTDGLSEPNRYGIIAQDLIGKYDHVLSQTRLPEGDDDTEYYGVAYTELIPILIKAVQELSAKVAALEAA